MQRGPIDVINAKLGKAEDFARLVEAHKRLICSVALAATRNIAASEAVARDVFIDAWRRFHTLKRPKQFRRWLLAIAREHTPLTGDTGGLVADTLKALPGFTREAFVLYCRENASLQTVAEQLDLSVDETRTRLLLAREHVPLHVLEDFADAVREVPAHFTAEVMAALPEATAPFAIPVTTSLARDIAVAIAVVMIAFGTAWVRPQPVEAEPVKPLRLLPDAFTPVTAGVRFSGSSFEGTAKPGSKVIVRLADTQHELGHALTNADGRFAVSGFSPGRYDVESDGVVRRGLVLGENETFAVALDQSTPATPVLLGHTTLRGRVVTERQSHALLDVQEVGSEAEPMRSELAQHQFALPRLPAGELVVRAIVDGEVGLVRTSGRDVAIHTCAPAAIMGKLEDAEVEVQLLDSAVPKTWSVDDGSFYLTEVPPGTFVLRTGTQRQWLHIECGEVKDVSPRG